MITKEIDWSYQDRIVKILGEMGEKRDSGNFSTLIVVPTGGGKTRIAMKYIKEHVINKGDKVLWLANKKLLLDQSHDSLLGFEGLEKCKCQIINGSSKKKTVSINVENINRETEILMATVDSLCSVLNKDADNHNRFNAFTNWIRGINLEGKRLHIIYDEAHHIGAEIVRALLKFLLCDISDSKIEKYALIGMTATVYRENEREIAEFYAWFKFGYNGKQVVYSDSELGDYGEINEEGKFGFDNRIDLISIDELIKSGVLIEPKFIRIDDSRKGNEILRKNELMNSGEQNKDLDILKAEADYLVNKIYGSKLSQWGKTIIFVETVKLAEKLCEELNKKNINSVVYTANESAHRESDVLEKKSEKRNDVLEKRKKEFERIGSECNFLITVSLVSEGYDYQDLSTIYLYAPIKSQIRLRQRIGRVIRQSENNPDKIPRVIWHCYQEAQDELRRPKPNPLDKDIPIDIDKFESEVEMDEEKRITKSDRSTYLLAPSYILPLKRENVTVRDTQIYYELLDVLSLFKVSELENYRGYYDLDGCKIYLDEVLIEGFEQFYRQIRTDCQVINEIFHNLNDYVQCLYGSSSDENIKKFYKSIKEDCFYKSDVKSSDIDIEKKKEKRFIVSEDQIERFFYWVINHDVCMPNFLNQTGDIVKEGLLYLRMKKVEAEKPSLENELKEIVADEILKKIEAELKDKDADVTLIDILNVTLSNNVEPGASKITSNLLSAYGYGACDNMLAEEMSSFRNLLSAGFCAEGRYQYKCNKDGKNKDLAFMYLEENCFVGENWFSTKLSKDSQSLIKYDNLQIARCLVRSIFHISVSEKDVKEYRDNLIKGLKSRDILFKDTEEEDKVVGEFLMALGYEGSGSEKIIKTQCQLFHDNLPNILKYVIYDKVYIILSGKANYTVSNTVSNNCQNREDLKKELEDYLEDFGLDASSLVPLTPVEDAIYDYRPYLKAVPHYQGIKPEFLCRMTNFLVQQVEGADTYVDVFGGSGASTLNFFLNGSKKMDQVFNEFGILNIAFYEIVKDDEKFNKFNQKIKDFIYIVKECDNDLNFMNKFVEYAEIIGKSTMVLKKKASAIAEEYTNKKGRGDKLRREILNSYYDRFIRHLSDVEIREEFVDKYIRMENVLYGIRKKCGIIYHYIMDKNESYNLSGEDLAFIFFLYNSFSDRQKFNDCSIYRFAEFCGKYENWLENGRLCMKDVTIHKGNANQLLASEKNKEKTVWYCDIPYSETSKSNYVGSHFDISGFINALNNLEGYYIVSSRYNVCCQKDFKQLFWGMGTMEGEEHEFEIKNINSRKFLMRRANILAFYHQFTDYDKKNMENVFVNIKNNELFNTKKGAESISRLKEYVETRIENSHNKAKYVIIPFTCVEEKAKDDMENSLKGNSLYKNNVSMSMNAFERMMQNTVYSNIPVEVMITNIVIREDVLINKKVADGIWAIPTFKTGIDASNYFVEPIVMVVQYDKFLELQYKYLFKEQYMKEESDKDRKESVAFFNLFLSNKNS